jgi:ankyrin repeat protein
MLIFYGLPVLFGLQLLGSTWWQHYSNRDIREQWEQQQRWAQRHPNNSRKPVVPVNDRDDSKPQLFHPGVGKRGMTELRYTACTGDLDGLTRCLNAGMDPNERDDNRGYTAVHWLADMAAADGPRVEMLHALVARGADINLKSATGKTALSLAREAGSKKGEELAAALLALGAKPE